MSKKTIFSFLILAIIVFSIWVFTDSNEKNDDFSERIKISLRDVGNQLLLSNQDSLSLILPVMELGESKFELSFEKRLSFYPDSLVAVVKRSFFKSNVSENYRVEVIRCVDREVAYSYEISIDSENTIIPCAGRYLPEQCYTIQFRLLDNRSIFFNKDTFLYVIVFVVFLMLQLIFYRKKPIQRIEENKEKFAAIGIFQFYPEQHKLVKEATEINLSKKECELLEIFVANPNQIIRRDELTKKVWEDNGVFVGRSLDTYISKLRKKLKDDASIKLTNIHGVGYKLEITP
ncbi:winged helix-turn-helix domain-containing protein [Flavobacteriaceae bacterium S356]|uniref:Winged helix-turn-helix domain-containing protein n=2 Tax=Asprobacillus argus TaxID=3076534 RepID=A0ABU3LCP9_9FLAO|nr:winged helix-turn-helix domain-containing protein [Flavobacteriaceae bacterium S356]